jgi:hypothetical protein
MTKRSISRKTTKSTKKTTRTLPRVARAKKPEKPVPFVPTEPKKAMNGLQSVMAASPTPVDDTKTRRISGTYEEVAAFVDRIRKEEAARTPAKPHPLKAAEVLYDHGAPREDLTDLEILTAMFDAPNAPALKDPTSRFLANVLLCNADEVDAAIGMNTGLDNSEIIDRIRMRNTYRASLATELARRFEVQS